jgi:hypothetical protein
MFVTLDVTDASGPDYKCVAIFGAHFPINLKALPNGPLQIHMGDATPIIIRQEDTDFCLIVFESECDEGWE